MGFKYIKFFYNHAATIIMEAEIPELWGQMIQPALTAQYLVGHSLGLSIRYKSYLLSTSLHCLACEST